MVFKSNFMGSMTSGLAIPPNKIDFNTVFDDLGSKTAENPYVLIVVCLIAGLYFLLLIPIVRMDRRDYRMVSLVFEHMHCNLHDCFYIWPDISLVVVTYHQFF